MCVRLVCLKRTCIPRLQSGVWNVSCSGRILQFLISIFPSHLLCHFSLFPISRSQSHISLRCSWEKMCAHCKNEQLFAMSFFSHFSTVAFAFNAPVVVQHWCSSSPPPPLKHKSYYSSYPCILHLTTCKEIGVNACKCNIFDFILRVRPFPWARFTILQRKNKLLGAFHPNVLSDVYGVYVVG